MQNLKFFYYKYYSFCVLHRSSLYGLKKISFAPHYRQISTLKLFHHTRFQLQSEIMELQSKKFNFNLRKWNFNLSKWNFNVRLSEHFTTKSCNFRLAYRSKMNRFGSDSSCSTLSSGKFLLASADFNGFRCRAKLADSFSLSLTACRLLWTVLWKSF